MTKPYPRRPHERAAGADDALSVAVGVALGVLLGLIVIWLIVSVAGAGA